MSGERQQSIRHERQLYLFGKAPPALPGEEGGEQRRLCRCRLILPLYMTTSIRCAGNTSLQPRSWTSEYIPCLYSAAIHAYFASPPPSRTTEMLVYRRLLSAPGTLSLLHFIFAAA